MLPNEPKPRAKWKAILVVVSCFVAGALAGVLVDHLVLMRHHRIFPKHGVKFVSSHVVRTLDRELSLTEDQKARTRAIVDRHHKNIEAKWAIVHPQIRAEIDAADREIAAILRPEQRGKFDKVRAKWRRRASSLQRH